MSQTEEKLKEAYAAWKSAEAEYEAAIAAVKSEAAAYDKDAIQEKIDRMIKFKNDFDLLDIDFPLPDLD